MKAKTVFFIAVGVALVYWLYTSMQSKTAAALSGVSPTLGAAGGMGLSTARGQAQFVTGGLPLTPANKGILAFVSPQPPGTMNPSPVSNDIPSRGIQGPVYNAIDDPGIQAYMMDQSFQDTATG